MLSTNPNSRTSTLITMSKENKKPLGLKMSESITSYSDMSKIMHTKPTTKINLIKKTDSLIDFTTTYGKVFDKKNAPLQQNNGNAPIVNNDGKKSHLMLGNDRATFETQNGSVYRNTNIPSNNHVHK